MSYSLEDFCTDVGAILMAGDDPDGREKIRQKLELLLCDESFCATYVGPDDSSGLRQIYTDSDLHFCVLTYNMSDARTSPPHDHGRTWAVYGQAAGYTDMTIWRVSDEGDGGRVEQDRTFRLEAGQVGLFDVGAIHSIQYTTGAKFVRVTGTDMSQEARRIFDLETGTVRVIENIASGSTG